MKLKKIFRAAVSCVIAAIIPIASCQYAGFYEAYHVSAAEYKADKSRVSVHDPSIIKANDGSYYVFGSHVAAAKSPDLQNWTPLQRSEYENMSSNKLFGNAGVNLKPAFDWAGQDMQDCKNGFSIWAPDVFWNDEYLNKDGSKGAYMIYFCTSSTYMRSVICFAVSKNIEGPYEFRENLIYSGFTKSDSTVGIATNNSSTRNINIKYTNTNIKNLIDSGKVSYNEKWFDSKGGFNNNDFPNAIDPTIYTDTNGNLWMCYGSWSGGIFTLQVDKQTGKLIHPKNGATADGRMTDSYFGTKIAGGCKLSGEGPFIDYNSDTGYYYLYVTYGGLLSAGGYNMRVFRSKSPDGPFTDSAGNNACITDRSAGNEKVGVKVMGNYKFSSIDKAYMACGHCSFLKDDDGKSYLFYHARFDDGTEYHEVRVHQVYYNADGWPVAAPYEYSGDDISSKGYSTEEITGSYEFINHGTNNGTVPLPVQSIRLNADGTISGNVTGTWTQDKDSPLCTLDVKGKKYKGYFLYMHDESKTGNMVMTFAVCGNDNTVLWGSKSSSEVVIRNDTVYMLTSKSSGMVLDVPNGKAEIGIKLQQWGKNGETAQEWRIIDLGNGYSKIVSMLNEEMALTVESGDGTNKSAIILQKWSEKDSQQFKIVNEAGGYCGITSKCSGDKGGVEVYDWSKEAGGMIDQWEYWSGDCQLWKISAVRKLDIPEQKEYLKGDIDRNDTINILDLIYGKQKLLDGYSVSASKEPEDMDGDGKFSVSDIIMLMKYLMGK